MLQISRLTPRRLRLPPPGRLPITGPIDAIPKYYRPGIGHVLRRRLVWALEALPSLPVRRLLEVGYGSGVFQYELHSRAKRSIGIDLHPHGARVKRRLKEDGIGSELIRGDAARLPFRDGSIDLVVVISVIEHTPHPARCLSELRRVLRPGGLLVCVVPRPLRWADAVFQLLTGTDPESDFRGGRERVREAIARVLPEARRLTRPAILPAFLAPYEIVIFQKEKI